MTPDLAPRIRRAALAALLGFALTAGAADPDSTDLKLTVKPGDTLIGLGRRLLEDPRRWPEVQRHNGIRNANRLVPGSTIAIPLSLLRGETSEITVSAVRGPVQNADGSPVATGDVLREGASIRTARDGYVTIRLVDGSTLQLQSRSDLTVARARRLPGSGATDSRFQIQAGQAEVQFKPAVPGASRFEVRTGFASAAVRGTRFRVGAGDRGSRTEVIEGTVAFAGVPPNADPTAIGDSVSVPQGFGSLVDESRRPIAPVRLLPAPALSQVPVIQYAPTLRYGFPPVDGAVGYRARLASDANFEQVVRESVFTGPQVDFSGLEAGSYVLRVRAIDRFSLEGSDGVSLVGILSVAPPAPTAPSAPPASGAPPAPTAPSPPASPSARVPNR